MAGTMKIRIMVTILLAATFAQGAQYLMYVGTFTKRDSKGIYVFRFDDKTGAASPLGLAAEASNPSWLALHPNGKTLYAANEDDNYQGQKSGSVTSFTIDHATGKLAKINIVPSRGPGPCHIAVDHAGLMLFAANYAGGSVASFPIKLDGALGEASHFVQHTGSSVNADRQSAPHAHSANIAPDNRFVFIDDLGLDEVLAYDLEMRPHSTPFARVKPGLGPRHMVFSANGKFAYVMNEMGGSVTVFAYDVKQGTFKELNNVSSLPAGYKGETSGAEIALHPTGKYLYVSNRGNSTISVFTVDKATGGLTLADATPTGGKTPRNFALDPSGNWLLAANQDTDNIAIFQIDRKTGKLTATGKTLPVSMPVCLTFTKAK
jgi:6-phosphogluconolactonase